MTKILILEIDPQCCKHCDFLDYSEYDRCLYCTVTRKMITDDKTQPSWCPLVDITDEAIALNAVVEAARALASRRADAILEGQAARIAYDKSVWDWLISALAALDD